MPIEEQDHYLCDNARRNSKQFGLRRSVWRYLEEKLAFEPRQKKVYEIYSPDGSFKFALLAERFSDVSLITLVAMKPEDDASAILDHKKKFDSHIRISLNSNGCILRAREVHPQWQEESEFQDKLSRKDLDFIDRIRIEYITHIVEHCKITPVEPPKRGR